MNRRLFLALLSASVFSAWTHGGGQIPGSTVIDDIGNLVVDDIGNSVVTS